MASQKALPNPSPERHPVLSFLTPNQDLIFWEKTDMRIQRNRDAVYGQAHWDTVNYPNHELVHITPLDAGGQWHQFYYAAKRENQDDYNYEIMGGEELIRTYIIPRADYLGRPVGTVGAGATEFLYPPAGAGSEDAVFSGYCFADDTLRRADNTLDSKYVIIQRRFIEPVTVEYIYNETLMRNVKVTKTVIPAGSFTPSIPSAGSTSEEKKGNFFHDIQIDQEIELGEGTLPYSLPSLPATYNKQFPPKLESIKLIGAWAFADSSDAASSYSEDYFFKFVVTDARPGPYSATVYRTITDDPEAVKTANPITIVPQPVSESIAVVAAWASGNTKGNSTSATAKEWNLPATIHPEVPVTVDGKPVPLSQSFYMTESVDETPGWTTFSGVTLCTVDFDVKQAPLGLFEVSVVKVDISNLYSNVYSGGGGGVVTVDAPTGVVATMVSSTAIDIDWVLPAEATGSKLFRSTDGVNYTLVVNFEDARLFYADHDLTPETTYYYRLRSTILGFESAYSASANATTDVAPPP